MSNRDYVRFQHMLDASQAAVSHLFSRNQEDLDHDRLLLNGVVRELEILGEAASRVSPNERKQFPLLPWKEMIGLRNRLIHAYFDVNNQAVWLVVKESLPPQTDKEVLVKKNARLGLRSSTLAIMTILLGTLPLQTLSK